MEILTNLTDVTATFRDFPPSIHTVIQIHFMIIKAVQFLAISIHIIHIVRAIIMLANGLISAKLVEC